MRSIPTISFCLLSGAFLTMHLPAAEPPLSSLGGAGTSGVLVHVGAEDGSLAIAAAKAGPVLALVLAPPAQVERIRAAVLAAGVAGQVQVQPAGATLPVIDGLASTVVLGSAVVPRAEAERALGPRGVLIEPGKPAWTKPVPKEHDDWGQYFRDGAATDVSSDLAVKPVSGLQWQAGTQNAGKLSSIVRPEPSTGLRIAGGVLLHAMGDGLTARDARSGAPLWRRSDLTVSQGNRYAFLADAALGRVWLLPKFTDEAKNRAAGPRHLQVLDLKTGADVATFDQGINFAMPDGYKLSHGETSRADDAQVRLDGQHLLCVAKADLAMLDASSGRKLWAATAPEGQGWWTPVLAGGTAYAVHGARQSTSSYTHWPMGMVTSVVAFDAASGKEKWRYAWPANERAVAVWNMTLHRDELVLAVSYPKLPGDGPNLNRARLLVLDSRSGAQKHYVDLESHDGLLKGHSHIRVMGIGDRWWINGISTDKTLSVAAPGDKTQWARTVPNLRPAGCQVWRATPNYLIGASTLARLDTGEIFWNTASRTACDIGAFPASGLLFQGENHCWCKAYLPGMHGMNGAHWPAAPAGDRLVAGTAKPAAAQPGEDAWPQYLQSPWRGGWNPSPLGGGELRQAWISAPPAAGAANPLVQREWKDLFIAQGQVVTGVSVAEGVAVYARVQEGEVVAVDPTTGAVRWRVALDGRIDSQPSIHQGLVLAGTRSGWIHALNRDNGQLVWRFRAAPQSAFLAANGQAESVWPVPGAVTVTSAGALVIAGRHNEMDGGLHWSLLDPATGALKASGVLSATQEDIDGNRVGINMPPISDGKHVFLANQLMVFEGGKLVRYSTGKTYGKNDRTPAWQRTRDIPLVQPKLSTLCVGLPKTGFNKDQYNGALSRQFVYRPGQADYLDMGGGGGGSFGGRGGGSEPNVSRMQRLEALESNGKDMVGAKNLWKAEFSRELGDLYGLRVLAATSDRVLLGLTHQGARGFSGKDRHQLVLLDYADGKKLQEIALSAPPITGGISIAQGRVYVACEDGSITCFTGK